MMNSNEYNFAYEFQQYAESIQNPLKTFRADYQWCSPEEDDYKDALDDHSMTRSSLNNFYANRNFTESYKTDEDFSVLLSNIKAHGIKEEKQRSNGDNIQLLNGNFLDIVGIRDPRTGENITIRQAIRTGIFDARSGEVIVNDKHISLELAAMKGYVDTKLSQFLLKPGLIKDPNGKELSLLELIHSEINESESRQALSKKRIKISSGAEENSTNPQKIDNALFKGNDDIALNDVNNVPDKFKSLAEAYSREYLIKHKSVTIKSSPLCLSDAIAHGIVDASGWITDRNSGDKFRLDLAVKKNLIDPNIIEVVDAKNDIKISVSEALQRGVLCSKTGRYSNGITKGKITFMEAKNRKFIVKPYTLKDIVDLNLVDKNEKIKSPMHRTKLGLTQAIETGVLDFNNLKCINKRKGQLITLQEAIEDDIIIAAKFKYRDYITGEIMTIHEAVDRGLISSVSQKSLFNIDGFKSWRSNDFVSFNIALSRDILCKRDHGFALEVSKNVYEPLEMAVTNNMVRQEVYEMFTKSVGVHDASGNELTVLDLCCQNLIDPKTGYLREPNTGKNVPLNKAIEAKFISPEGALFLSSLLNITLTTETVTRTLNRYVSIQTTAQGKQDRLLTFTEAICQGLIDEDRHLYHDQQTGNVYSVQQALSYGLLTPDLNDHLSEINYYYSKSTKAVMHTENGAEVKLDKNFNIKADNSNSLKVEVPPGGWLLRDAIDLGHFNADRGTLRVDNCCIPFKESIERNLINNLSFSVIDPQTQKKLSIYSAIKRNIIDSHGLYKDILNRKINIRCAINEGIIILEKVNNKTCPLNMCKVRHTSGVENTSVTLSELNVMSSEDESPATLQIAPGQIYDPATLLIIFTETGQSENILKAALEGRIDEHFIKIIDPRSNEEVSIEEAIIRKIYDSKNGMILTNSGELKHVDEAMRIGLVKVSGTPLIPLENTLQKLHYVTSPRTDSILPLEVAYKRDIVPGKLPSDISITLQKMRKIILKPIDALEKGIIDAETREILEHFSNKEVSLKNAIDMGFIDGCKGNILDLQRNRNLNITQAAEENLLEPYFSNLILIPLAKSLSIPKLLEQGLIDLDSQKIIHPDNGYLLNINEAIICDILDPLSIIQKPIKLTLQNAIKNGIVDGVASLFKVGNKVFNLSQAVEGEVFDISYDLNATNYLPPIAMTFPVAVERNLINSNKNEITHPYTGTKISIIEALENNTIMCIPYPPRVDAIEIERALKEDLIDFTNQSLTFPKTGEIIAIRNALEEGYLLLKPLSTFVALQKPLSRTKVVETIRSLHTVTTTTIELMQGYVLVSNNQVLNIQTGEMCTIDKAKKLGIVTEILKQNNETPMKSEKIELGEKETCTEEKNGNQFKIVPTDNFCVNKGDSEFENIRAMYRVEEDKQRLQACQDYSNDFIANDMQNELFQMCACPAEFPIDDAISQNLREPWVCRTIINSENNFDSLDKLLEKKRRCVLDEEQIHNQNLVALERDSCLINSPHLLTPEKMNESHTFDQESYRFDKACSEGILVSTSDPLQNNSTNSSRYISLEEAISCNIIDPNTALVRYLPFYKLIPFHLAQENNWINIKTKNLIDPKAFFFAYDPSITIYLREPISFDQAVETKSLDLETGMLTYKMDSNGTSDNEIGETYSGGKLNRRADIYSLKDAVSAGIIDPVSALIKDKAKNKFVGLSEGFRKGLIDANKANILNTKTYTLCSLQKAYETGLLVTPKRLFGLIETLKYNLYNPENGYFMDPFQMNHDSKHDNQFTLQETIACGFLDPSSTVVRDSTVDKIVSLTAAINSGLIDGIKGRLIYDGNRMDLLRAFQMGLILPAEQRQAVFEKFNVCEEYVNELITWVSTIEYKISNVGGPKEKIDEIRSQTNILRQIKEEIDGHQRPVSACLEQIRQIVLTGADVLSAPEVATLENAGRELRSRVDRASDRALRLLRRLETIRDELSKLCGELSIFFNWLQEARHRLEDNEQSLADIKNLSSHGDSIREFVSDVIGHQADLRFVTMSAQRFVDGSKEFLTILNDFRTALPERLPHIEPIPNAESPIRQEVSLMSTQYKDLLHRANALQDRISGLNGCQRAFHNAIYKADEWIGNIQPRVARLIAEPVSGDTKAAFEQMSEAKTVHTELLSNGRLIDNVDQTLDDLVKILGSQLSPSESKNLEKPALELKCKYQKMLDTLGEHCRVLDKTLVQSQSVQDALENLVLWVNIAEDKFKLQFRPASLIKERLLEQIREHKTLLTDVNSHQTTIDSVQTSAKHLIDSASNTRIANKVESNLKAVSEKVDKLIEKLCKRGEFLDDVYSHLQRCLDEIERTERDLLSLQEMIDSLDAINLPIDTLLSRSEEAVCQKESKKPVYENCVSNCKNLIGQRDVTDTSFLRDRIKALENLWRNINILLDERTKLSKLKAEQKVKYENIKEEVMSWLTEMEAFISKMSPVAIDLKVIRQQNVELKPLLHKYRAFSEYIDKINDVGAQYDALFHPESPSRRSITQSPAKRVSPMRATTGDGRSPSPNKGGVLSPLSTGSSGFGSRRSSQDGFQISEFSPVQQQIKEISNRYSLIGVRLTDRQNEIDNMIEEVRKQYENLKSLSLFLERIQRQVPKESASNKDEAEHCIKQTRKILEDMYEKQSLLDTTKAQVKDILRRKSDVTGADELRQENDNIIEKWKNLSEVCKSRIQFSEKLRDFLDIQNNLSNWLHSKERILTVLGPISTDSRMVQSQVQQVQVLREEFRIQQPHLNHFQEIGRDILNCISNPSEIAKVEQKLNDIINKWDDLVSRLDDRANNLGGAADSSKEFDAAVNRLRESLQTISDSLDNLPADGEYQENLRKIEHLDRQLEGQRSLLADAEQSAVLLCNILGDAASRGDVNSRVSALEKQYQALQRKLDTKKAETEASLRDSRTLSENCTKMLGWLSSELSNMSEKLLLSAHKPTLQHQIDAHDPIYREVMSREHEIIMLTNKGKELSDRQQHRTIKRDLERILQLWEKLRREVSERHSRLQTCMEHSKKYSQVSETFLLWLRKAEDKLANLTPGKLYKSNMENRLRDIQTLRSEVWKHSNEYETTKGLGETFISYCDTDKDPIKCELKDIKDRWEQLNNDLITKTQDIENCSRRLSDFNDNLRSLDYAVGRCEDRLAAHDALGGAAKDPKLIERVKAIRDELTKLEKPLTELKSMAKTMSLESHTTGGDADHFSNDVDNIFDRVSDLKNRLNDRFDELQSAASTISKLNNKIKCFLSDLNQLEREIENLAPPGREVNIVRSQLKDISDIYLKLEDMSNSVNDMDHTSSTLIDSGITTENQIPAQISSIRSTLNRLDIQSRNHERSLQNTLKALLDFFDANSQVLEKLRNIKQEFDNLKPVSSELDQIRRQQHDFREFRNLKVDSLAQNIIQVNNSGRDLVRSAGSGISTVIIEKELEALNDYWNNLKDLMNERERRLGIALLQSGRFQEALSGLSKWLLDTEEMVANQKPPSSDYKVVKAQLQEQKFLKKMLMDRQNSMSSLSLMGIEVANASEPLERDLIEGQLNDLVKRFDSLTNGAEKRENDLEAAMEVAKAFHDKLIPLELWLDGGERSIKNMELIPTDEEKIQNRIKDHNDLHVEILSKKLDFTDLADVAGQLMHLVGEDEAVQLGEKVRNITDRFTTLVDVSENIGSLLAESRQGLRHLVITYQELVGWMDRMEDELTRFKLIPVYSEKLMEQMDNLVELNENIASQAPNIESTVDSGSELMKHISNDEALQLKDKLDALQRRYGELATRGGDLLKKAKNALPLVQQFHDSHKRLLEWLQVAESALTASELCHADIIRLETELVDMRLVIDNINLFGPQLCQISPGEGSASIESIVTRANRRFDSVVEQIQRKAERFNLSIQRVKEVSGDIDELVEWFRDMDTTLREADPPAIEPTLVRFQLQEHRSINDDISSQKGRVRDVAASSKKIVRESPQTEYIASLREKLEDLKEIVDSVAQLCSERLGILEQALPLSEHFAESHNGLSSWLDDMEQQVSRFSMPALRPDQITTQQDKNERLLLSITEHKPLLDKLNKTGEALTALVSDEDSAKINDFLDSDNARFVALRLELRERQQILDNALQESSRFSDKLEGMLRALANTVDQVNQLDPLSALPLKIREQMEDNAALTEDLDKRSDAFTAVKKAADEVIAKAGSRGDPAVRDIKFKLEKLNSLWNDVQKATKNRGSSLDDILNVAEPFWEQLNGVMGTLKDLEETLSSQEPPAAQPQEIQKQQVALQEVRFKIDQTKPEVEQVRRNGSNLINMCGEPDKPEVKKHIDDLDSAWDSITALYAKREENLIDAMEKAMEFHETLQNLEKFLSKAERNFEVLGAVGSDIDAVKKQIEQLRGFKDDVDPHMLEVEALNRQAVELTDRTSPEQATSIRKPLSVANQRWEALLRNMVGRQKQLEHALLHLGQFQHALNELLIWIDKTDATLDQLKQIPGDPQLLEVELAKLKVIANDIQAHQNSVDTLNDAGRQLIETEKGTIEASTTQEKLRKLNSKWKMLIQKASDRQHELEEALHEAQEYIAEVQDILGWLGDVDAVIGASKPVGGLPETATEQLERFMEVYNELDENRPKVETIQVQGQEYIKRQNHIKSPSSNLQHTLRTLKQRWDTIISRASDKKIKLEIALKEATEFHDTLQAFVEWLDQAEKQLSNAPPVSRVLRTIQDQIEEHKILQKDVSTHREAMLLLDKKGTHLKYFSQKQDVILIKNLLVSVQHRWERIVSKSAERTRALDHGYKEARDFNDSWNNIMQYLQETDVILGQIIEDATKSKEPSRIKKLINKLKDTHRQLTTKQTTYDSTLRSGKNLLERAPKGDETIIVKMLTELKEKWATVWSKSIERQRKMEEALLLSGQFSDALCELIDWLKKAKHRLNENGLVHGDLETVQGLIEHHKHIEHDLQKRAAQMQGVLKTGRELAKSSDNKEIDQQLNDLQILWDEVIDASKKRNDRLQEAIKDAEKLNRDVHTIFGWLDHAEQKLRYAKNAPDDEKITQEMIALHNDFTKDLQNREYLKAQTFQFAEEVINKAYPDAIPIIKNWLTIIQQRWDEVAQWSINRDAKLEQHLQSLKDLDNIIEELLAWLNGLEATLLNLEKEKLPDEITELEQLIEDHREFMENTARRQVEVDRACKPKQQPSSSRRSLSRVSKTPILKGSREQGLNILNTRRHNRLTPNRDTPDRDRLPHYGPRFSQSISSAAQELEFRSPRASLLWDKWRYVWMMSWERQRRLHDHMLYLKDMERVRNFSWDDWRKRFLRYMNHKKSRLTDLFRKMDKDNNGLIPRSEFIDGILNTKFDTSRMEMSAVADLFDRNGEGLIDWQEFIAALRPDWQERKPVTDSDKIHDEVKRLVMLCTCRQKFRVFQVGEGKYRFGDSQKLRLVRILRSTVMVRVGGGWVALDEFLQKNDPCRAKGRTNIELREQFILADGVSQSMAAFTPRRSTTTNATQNGNVSPYISGQGPIIKVRERSVRSIPMSRPSRSSQSASTPDSLSDNEFGQGGAPGRYTPRKITYTSTRSVTTPSGSRTGSKPNSRPLSRQGSKPSSRHGSNLSLDSTDETTPSRIPQRKSSSSNISTGNGITTRPSRLSVISVSHDAGSSARKTVSGSASPAQNRKNTSGSSTPSGTRTPRKGSTDPTVSSTMKSQIQRGTPVNKREPFRL